MLLVASTAGGSLAQKNQCIDDNKSEPAATPAPAYARTRI